MSHSQNTPMMAQYLSIKKSYPDAILFYRMGDFYEMFHDDAVKASAILEIALTSRNKNQKDAIPMCGVPCRAADTYISKLIEGGCKVAVCEQMEDPSTVKGLVKREVVRVITPGMILNEELLDRRANNYLLALSIAEGQAGMAWLDISTGEFRVTETSTFNGKIPAHMLDEACRIAPSELLLPHPFKNDPAFAYLHKRFSEFGVTYLERYHFKMPEARERLLKTFATRSLKGFGCDHLTAGISAAGAIMGYVQETQMQDVTHIGTLRLFDMGNYLVLNDRSFRNLEIFANIETGTKKGTLISILDDTVTAMGARLLRQWLRYPLIDKEEIDARLDAVENALQLKKIRIGLRTSLKSVYDLERLGSKISMGHGTPKDLLALKSSLLKLPDIFADLNQLSAPLFKGAFIENRAVVASELTELARIVDEAIREDAPMVTNEGGIIRDGFDPALDELIELSRNGKAWILKKGLDEREKTGLSSLKIKFNKVFGYFIEISKTQATSAPDHYIRKQTLVNAERFITEELKEMETKLLTAQDRRAELEYALFCSVRKKIVEKTASILTMASFLATVDVLVSFAHTAESNQYVRPVIVSDEKRSETSSLAASQSSGAPSYSSSSSSSLSSSPPPSSSSSPSTSKATAALSKAPSTSASTSQPALRSRKLSIVDGRHPVVEQMIDGERYVPGSVTLDDESGQVLIITGPNMAGKSTVLRQVALQVLMAQSGSFVPAAEATIPITDRIFTRVGALDNLSQGQSTFMVEMEETANIINNVTPRSLVILDEIGRGTSTFDGLSIAWAVAEYLHDLDGGRGVKTLFATHYHELTRLESLKPRVKNFNIAVKEFNDNIIFLRKMVPGATNRSYGIQVARLAGVPDDVVLRAKTILETIEKQNDPLAEEHLFSLFDHRNTNEGRRKGRQNNQGKRNNRKKSDTPMDQDPTDLSEQMDLFHSPSPSHETLLSKIKSLDIGTMTPIAALNFLNEIHGELVGHGCR